MIKYIWEIPLACPFFLENYCVLPEYYKCVLPPLT